MFERFYQWGMTCASRILFVAAIGMAIGGLFAASRGFGGSYAFGMLAGVTSGFWPFLGAVAIDRFDRLLRLRAAG